MGSKDNLTIMSLYLLSKLLTIGENSFKRTQKVTLEKVVQNFSLKSFNFGGTSKFINEKDRAVKRVIFRQNRWN